MKYDPIIYTLAATLLFIGIGFIFDRSERKYFWPLAFFFFGGTNFFFTGLSISGKPDEYISATRWGYIGSTQAILLGLLITSLTIFVWINAPLIERTLSRKSSKKNKSIKSTSIPDPNQPEEPDFDDLHKEFEESLKDSKETEPNKPIRKPYYEL